MNTSIFKWYYHVDHHFREHHQFVLLCLKLLSAHLSLALTGGLATSVLGGQARPLRHLLFRLVNYRTYKKMPGNSIIYNQLVWFPAVIHVSSFIIFNIQLKQTIVYQTLKSGQ
jgi:hypothetical protein